MDTYEFLTPQDFALLQANVKTRRKERRIDERVAIDLHVAVRASSKVTVQGRASNMSTQGIFIEAPADLLPHEGQIELRSYQGDVMLTAVGDIVHKDAGGIGVRLRAPVMVYELVDGQHFALDPLAIAV
jgi:hypothetical protein